MLVEHLHHFFASPPRSLPPVAGSHDMALVVLSILVAVVLATLSLSTAKLAQDTTNPSYRKAAILMGAFALGTGIWTMHFIAMLAFTLPVPVRYDGFTTFLSVLPAWLASWVALHLLARPKIGARLLIGSGVVVGLGIGAMHYIGMSAMITPLYMHHDPLWFAVSMVVAIILAILALWIRFGLTRLILSVRWRYVLGGTIMGFAISGMHYIAMLAVRFYGDTHAGTQGGVWVSTSQAALALSSLVITIGIAVAVLNSLFHSRELYAIAERNKSRLQAILNTTVDSIITIDEYGRIQDFNAAAEKFFGYRASEVWGKNVKMLMPEPYHSRHDEYLENYRITNQARIIGIGREVVARRKDGSQVPIRLAVGKVESRIDDERLFVGIISDISERKTLIESLRETAARAEQAAAAKSRFLANMSHEIRTPMNAIIGFSELLLQTNLTAQQRSHLNTVAESSRSLLRLLNEILDTTKLEESQLELEINHFSLKSVASQLESSLRLDAQAKQLAFQVDYPAATPEFFQGDALRLVQVLNNLVGNAIKFTEKGGVSIHFSYDGKQLHVTISDTGIGMTPEQLNTVFEPFVQADASISRRFGGTGLGTTIARQIVLAMGGRIEVDSTPGEGTTFRVVISMPLGEQPRPSTPLNIPQLPPLRVLIVDDVEQNLRLLRTVLEHEGHTVQEASDGAQAVETYLQHYFDVILMDLHMPGVDGAQATQMIRQHEREHGRSHTPVIALTASVLQPDRDRAEKTGMDGFAVKPLERDALFAEMGRVLEQRLDTAKAPSLIDWARGESLWGSRSVHQQELQRFVEDELSQARFAVLAAESPDSDTLLFRLHRLHGVAANLALTQLAALAGKLESLLRQGKRSSVLEQLPELDQMMMRVDAEVKAGQEATPHGVGDSHGQNPTLDDEDLQGAECLQQLVCILQRNELDDAALARVCRWLQGRPHDVRQLKQMINAFDFEGACQLLMSWMPEPVPPMDEDS